MLASAEPVAHADRMRGADCPGWSVLVPAELITHGDQMQGADCLECHTAQRTLSLLHWGVVPPASPTTWSVGP